MTSVEDYLIDRINQKYAGRIFQKLNTEWEKIGMQGGTPGVTEYEHMLARALELHRRLTSVPDEKGDERNDEKTKD